MHHARYFLRALSMTCVLCAGCAVGPNFKRPNAPDAAHYTGSPPVETVAVPTRGGAAQRFVAGADVPHDWWKLFQSAALDRLVSEALANNPTLQSARAALRQAQENAAAQRGLFYPNAQASYSFTRQRDAIGTLSPTLSSGVPLFNLHTAQVNVSYLFDLFGLNRRQVESADALAESQWFETEAAYQTLVANVVNAAVQEASLREQLAAAQAVIKAEREAAQIFHRQYDIGLISMSEVALQESQLATAEAVIPALEKQLAQERDQLTVLVGRLPSDGMQEHFDLSAVELPTELPLSVPAKLIDQRPDVRAAEAQMHAAAAQVGVAIANMLPQVELTATSGGASGTFRHLFASDNRFWSAGASLTQTLFAGGSLYHREKAASAQLDQMGAQYRAVVLAAFQDVADTLHALQSDADALAAELRAEQAARESLTVAESNLKIGLGNQLLLLTAEQNYQQAVMALAQARANRFADTVALFQALGGGWWNREATASMRHELR